LAWALLLVTSMSAGAVVVRDDVPDERYRVPASEFPALVDLPVEGHGVLIAPQWVVTAGHAVHWQPSLDDVTLGGKPRKVEKIVYHAGFRMLPTAAVRLLAQLP